MNYSTLKTNLGKKGNGFRIKGLMCNKSGNWEYIVSNSKRGGFDKREFLVKGLKAKWLLDKVSNGLTLADAPEETGNVKFADCEDLIGKTIYLIQEGTDGKKYAFPVKIYGVLKNNHKYYFITDNFGRVSGTRYSCIRTVRISYIKKHLDTKYLKAEDYEANASSYTLMDVYDWKRSGNYSSTEE